MPLEDLDLVFEDDEDQNKKKSTGAIAGDLSLAFGVQGEEKKIPPVKKVQASPPASAVARPGALKVVKNEVSPAPLSSTVASASHLETKSSGSVAYTDMQATIKVATLEAKLEFMVEMMSDAKLLDFQVNQLLSRIYQRDPNSKAEVLAIKKLLADFITKKRK